MRTISFQYVRKALLITAAFDGHTVNMVWALTLKMPGPWARSQDQLTICWTALTPLKYHWRKLW